MSTLVYFVIGVAVGVALWMMRREMGVGKILAAALFWPFAAALALYFYLPFVAGRKAKRAIAKGIGARAGTGVKPIREGETYQISDPTMRSPEVVAPAPDVEIKIPQFGPISDQAPGQTPARPKA